MSPVKSSAAGMALRCRNQCLSTLKHRARPANLQARSYERGAVSEKSSIYGHFRERSRASVHVCPRRFIGQSLVSGNRRQATDGECRVGSNRGPETTDSFQSVSRFECKLSARRPNTADSARIQPNERVARRSCWKCSNSSVTSFTSALPHIAE